MKTEKTEDPFPFSILTFAPSCKKNTPVELNVTSETMPGLICSRESEVSRCCFQLNLW